MVLDVYCCVERRGAVDYGNLLNVCPEDWKATRESESEVKLPSSYLLGGSEEGYALSGDQKTQTKTSLTPRLTVP